MSKYHYEQRNERTRVSLEIGGVALCRTTLEPAPDGEPYLGVGVMVGCCEEHSQAIVLAGTVTIMAGVIAAIEEYARRNGLEAALTAALDQGRANVRVVGDGRS